MTTDIEPADDQPGVIIFPPLLFVICIVAGLIAYVAFPYRLPLPTWVRGAFVGATIGAVAFATWGKRTMKAAGTNVHPGMPTLAIVDAGPFGFTRNPLYLTLVIMFVGIGLALASPAFLLFLIPLVLVLHFGVVLREERYLEAKFGDAYRGYKARVRRWI